LQPFAIGLESGYPSMQGFLVLKPGRDLEVTERQRPCFP
jgi:hypothetical protein